ncbi:MAG TPA: hypothetical protein VF610_05750, partial [Segetibacter sp.]
PVLTSMKNAGAIKSGGKTGKDKTKEKRQNDPIKQTDYSDAFDMQAMAVIRGLISGDARVFVGDIGTR